MDFTHNLKDLIKLNQIKNISELKSEVSSAYPHSIYSQDEMSKEMK